MESEEAASATTSPAADPVPTTATTSGPPPTTTTPFRFRTSLRNTVFQVMRDRGWRECEADDWDFYWADVHWVHEMFDKTYMHEGQKINHFRNHYELTRKDLLGMF